MLKARGGSLAPLHYSLNNVIQPQGQKLIIGCRHLYVLCEQKQGQVIWRHTYACISIMHVKERGIRML